MHHTQLQTLSLSQVVLLVIALFLVLAFYFLPTIMAIKRKSPHTTAVVILNLFFGVTLIGWIVSLILASKQPQSVIVVYNSPPPPRRAS
jgi:RsiW-degrading membrane proteinase PrsW (M82 family)